jgi:hypothetical protein
MHEGGYAAKSWAYGRAHKRNFILQQGFGEPPAESCALHYSALHFQPRTVGPSALIAVILQSPMLFLLLSAVLRGNALVPDWNLFDRLYKGTLGRRAVATQLRRAPARRRFAQGLPGCPIPLLSASNGFSCDPEGTYQERRSHFGRTEWAIE